MMTLFYSLQTARLLTISDRMNSATYSYLANSPLVPGILFQPSDATRMTTTRSCDTLNRPPGRKPRPLRNQQVRRERENSQAKWNAVAIPGLTPLLMEQSHRFIS